MKIYSHFLFSQCDELLKEKNDSTKKCEELQKRLSALEISQKSDSEQMRNYQVHLITSKEILILDYCRLQGLLKRISPKPLSLNLALAILLEVEYLPINSIEYFFFTN